MLGLSVSQSLNLVSQTKPKENKQIQGQSEQTKQTKSTHTHTKHNKTKQTHNKTKQSRRKTKPNKADTKQRKTPAKTQEHEARHKPTQPPNARRRAEASSACEKGHVWPSALAVLSALQRTSQEWGWGVGGWVGWGGVGWGGGGLFGDS